MCYLEAFGQKRNLYLAGCLQYFIFTRKVKEEILPPLRYLKFLFYLGIQLEFKQINHFPTSVKFVIYFEIILIDFTAKRLILFL